MIANIISTIANASTSFSNLNAPRFPASRLRSDLLQSTTAVVKQALSDEEREFVPVRRVRSNLFDGARFAMGGERAYVRDRQPVEAALAFWAAKALLDRRAVGWQAGDRHAFTPGPCLRQDKGGRRLFTDP
jgi:hypothetical protein